MPRSYNRLTAARVAKIVAARVPGKHPDGDGLSLVVARSGVASWVYRFMIAGKSHEMGLGPARDVGLKQAREAALEARGLKRSGIDPLAARQARQRGAAVAKAKTMTFQQCAKAYIAAHQASWSAQHGKQWVASVEKYCYPVFGHLPVADIDLPLVMQVIEPLWNTATETGSRVRGRIEKILDYAKTRGVRDGENPARWKGHLENMLPKVSKVAAIEHYPELPYQEIAGFMKKLRAHDDVSARALELMILCATRKAEVLGATWDEFKLRERLWVIPAARMKARKEHRLPLSDAAMAILEKQKAIKSNQYVFAAGYGAGHLNKNTPGRVLKRLGCSGVVAHGFRATFRVWATEQTEFPSEVIEMALAHNVGDATLRAYMRTDQFDKRRELAEAWARYCAGGAEVVNISVAVKSAS